MLVIVSKVVRLVKFSQMSGTETALDIFYTPFSLFRQNLPLYLIIYTLPLQKICEHPEIKLIH